MDRARRKSDAAGPQGDVISSRLAPDLFEIAIRDDGQGFRLAKSCLRWRRKTSWPSTAAGYSSRRSISTRCRSTKPATK